MFYADESQLYITIDPDDQRPALKTPHKCVSKVIEWNTINKLVCNPRKTEFIQLSSRFVTNPILSEFLIGNARVQPSDRVCNPGVNLDRELNLSHHMLLLCRAWIIVTVYTVAYPSEKWTSCSMFRTVPHNWCQE